MEKLERLKSMIVSATYLTNQEKYNLIELVRRNPKRVEKISKMLEKRKVLD